MHGCYVLYMRLIYAANSSLVLACGSVRAIIKIVAHMRLAYSGTGFFKRQFVCSEVT
jgi:hypothetical protein